MISFHAADSYSLLGIILGVAVVPIAILAMLFFIARTLLGI
jgi:hypothetical protein